MNLMGWLHGGKRSKAKPAEPPALVPAEPEAPQSSFAERVERWRAYFRAQRAAEPTAEQIEQARARRRRQQLEAEEERIAMHLAYKGIYIEGEPLEGPATPQAGGGLFADVLEQQRQDFHWWNRS